MSFNPDMQEFQSPFRLPTDEEVFITREAERLQKQELKDKVKDMKIWDKQTSCTKGALKRPNETDFNVKPIEENQYQQFVRPKERNIITAALEIVNQRAKLPQNQKSENIRDYVEQKKEIFRVEMKYRILKEEREKIYKRISNKEAALKRSEELLLHDTQRFTENIDRNKVLKEEAISQANLETQAKKDKEAEIKQMDQRKAAITAEISRNEEYLESLKKYKSFLDELAPPNWRDRLNKNLQQKYELVKQEWIMRQNIDEAQDSYLDVDAESQHSGGTQQSSRKKRSLAGNKRTKLEKKFDDLVARGIIDVFAEDDEEMYFKNPDELSGMLKELEDNNLFLIELIQEMDHQLEVAKSEFDNLHEDNEKKCEDLRKDKEHLGWNLETHGAKLSLMDRRISSIQSKKESNKTAQILRDEIGRCFAFLSPENDSGLPPIEMLKYIENSINVLLNKLNYLRKKIPDTINKLESQRETDRRDNVRELTQKLKDKNDSDNIIKAQKRAMNPSHKKIGRHEMNKVLIQKKNVEREVKHVQKSEEELIKEFLEETTS